MQRFSAFIEARREHILIEWVAFARTLLPWAKGMDEKGLRDHAEELLAAVVSDMEQPQSGREQAEKSKGHAAEGALARVGQRHATERLKTGFKLNELVSEYRALRASVLRQWGEVNGDTQGEITRFNEAIDETLGEGAAWYGEELHRTREQFLAILGHDLRSPLSAMIMGAERLARSESIDDKDVRIAVRIAHTGARMSRMIEDLLDLTRTRLGDGIPITIAPMDLSLVCDVVIAELEAVHPERTISLQVRGDVRGEWDGDRLTQVLTNLVANALQYGDATAPVSVVAEALHDNVELRVNNRGSPIPADELRSIFEPMVRHQPRDRDVNSNGLGLGLYIAREIVAAHEGTIQVASSEADGTTFTVRLPRRRKSHQI